MSETRHLSCVTLEELGHYAIYRASIFEIKRAISFLSRRLECQGGTPSALQDDKMPLEDMEMSASLLY